MPGTILPLTLFLSLGLSGTPAQAPPVEVTLGAVSASLPIPRGLCLLDQDRPRDAAYLALRQEMAAP